MNEQFLTVEQVAQRLQLHPYTVLKYIKEGKLGGLKLGRRYRIKKSDVDVFLNKHGFEKTSQPKPVSKEIHKLEVENNKEDTFKIQEQKAHGIENQSDHYIIE